MKKILISILLIIGLASAGVLRAENIGVPAECEGVMLQAFYWDSYKLTKYGRTKWVDLLKDTAAINANFDLRCKVLNVAEENARMVMAARSAGASAKFAGSGGAIIGTYHSNEMLQQLRLKLGDIGCTVITPHVVPPEG